MDQPLKVYVSSKSPVKHRAIKAAFKRMGTDIATIGFSVDSGVADQPRSIGETHAGATNRHAALREHMTNEAAYLVTCESGQVQLLPTDGWRGLEVVIIERVPTGMVRTGIDLGVETPSGLMERIPHEYPDLGALIKQEFGAVESDSVPFFTKGRLTRAELIEQALFKVLSQMDGVSP